MTLVVGRAAAMMLVLCGLIASGWGFYQHHHPKTKALLDTGNQLYLTKKWADTYDGPDLKNFKDLTLVRASDTNFCIEVVKDASVFRLIGPGGVPEPGTCQ
jgi:hypothetical protein